MLTYEWDVEKAESNYTKHRIRFPDALAVFADEGALTIEDEDDREERYVIIGHDGIGRLLVVVFTWRGEELVRLISARRATRSESRAYYLKDR